jgi:hypothetical protein
VCIGIKAMAAHDEPLCAAVNALETTHDAFISALNEIDHWFLNLCTKRQKRWVYAEELEYYQQPESVNKPLLHPEIKASLDTSIKNHIGCFPGVKYQALWITEYIEILKSALKEIDPDSADWSDECIEQRIEELHMQVAAAKKACDAAIKTLAQIEPPEADTSQMRAEIRDGLCKTSIFATTIRECTEHIEKADKCLKGAGEPHLDSFMRRITEGTCAYYIAIRDLFSPEVDFYNDILTEYVALCIRLGV